MPIGEIYFDSDESVGEVVLDEDVGQPSWPEILETAIRAKLKDAHTALPGEIVDYDPATNRATIALGLTHNGDVVPNLPDVPVLWPGGTKGFMHGELEAEDGVLVVFTEESFGQWDENGGVNDPGLLRRFGLHATAIPGFRREGKGLAGISGVTHLVGTEVRLGSLDASEFVALAAKVEAKMDAIANALKNALTGASDGGALYKTNIIAALAASYDLLPDVAAEKVKAK